ncbi:MAG: glutamyl-tRNA amidotransferase [Nitrospirae bacterium RBG_13_39_12]|nr:MAG: glutamyl-tRNA amidotransferase [Nitrospirae bacterium RBG_13_39_12]
MSFLQKLDDDLKIALKTSDSLKVSVLRIAKAALKNKQIEKRQELSDEDILSVISTLSKQSKESIDQFTRGGREDLAEKERQELSILQSYLPKQLTAEEIDSIIIDTIKESSAKDTRDFGKVMRLVMPRVKGRVDGNTVNQRVKDLLEKV